MHLFLIKTCKFKVYGNPLKYLYTCIPVRYLHVIYLQSMQFHCIQKWSWGVHYSQTLSLFSYAGKSLKLIHKHLLFSDLFLPLNIVLETAFKYHKIKVRNREVPKSRIQNKNMLSGLCVCYPVGTIRENIDNSLTWIHTEIKKKA